LGQISSNWSRADVAITPIYSDAFKIAAISRVDYIVLNLLLINHEAISRPEGLPNGACSPRRGETAKQVDRGRGGTALLGTVSSQRQSFIDHLSPKQSR